MIKTEELLSYSSEVISSGAALYQDLDSFVGDRLSRRELDLLHEHFLRRLQEMEEAITSKAELADLR